MSRKVAGNTYVNFPLVRQRIDFSWQTKEQYRTPGGSAVYETARALLIEAKACGNCVSAFLTRMFFFGGFFFGGVAVVAIAM
jgi:hypothetical protein